MSTPKRSRVSNRLSLTHISRLPKLVMAWLLRLIFASARFSRTRQAGFVLPTTVLLILILTLTVGGLSFRSFSRVGQTIAYREQQKVDNFAAPAIDRAKAKLEYLFTRDKAIIDKRPPSSGALVEALLANAKGTAWKDADHTDKDPYTLPDEKQLDINGDGLADPAWSFEADGNTVVYSLLVSHDSRDQDGNQVNVDGAVLSFDSDETDKKADNLVTRNGPINTAKSLSGCPISAFAGDGWQDTLGNLQKNFQINILSISNPDGVNRTVSAAEYQQVRGAPKGNKYGAWFRYDLEIFPGAAFRWNGAMHSESNIISGANLEAYLVSSPNSCIFSDDASEITISESEYDLDGDGAIDETFIGHLVSGASKTDTFGRIGGAGSGKVVIHDYVGGAPKNNDELNDDTHSILEGGPLTGIAVDPVLIFTEDRTKNLNDSGAGSWNPDPARDPNLLENSDRVVNFPDAARPFLDDGYRADNRYGPKPVYDKDNSLKEKDGVAFGTSKKIGDPIVNHSALSSDNPAEQEYGLDGYWERRAIAQGLRVIVGQRLELGNRFGWEADDPLYPPTAVDDLKGSKGVAKGPAEAKQQKSLRDNLAAVQGMVAYHYSVDSGQIPYICAASTVHPGTQKSLINSRTFEKYPETDNWKIDFLTGQGTNGWEFDFSSFDSNGNGDITDEFVATTPMGKALRNLAYFAGDPQGGAPSFLPVQGVEGQADEFVHPYPYQSMWGDFSVLRRIFDEYLDAGTSYVNLSPADKSTLHSAACTLGMLAYNLDQLEGYDATKFSDANLSTTYGTDISNQGQVKNLVGGPVWDAFIANGSCTVVGPKEFNCFPAEFLTRDELISQAGLTGDALAFAKYLSDVSQVERDRKYGFEQSPQSATLGVFPVRMPGNITYNMYFPDECHPNDVGGAVGIGIIDELFNANIPFNPNSDNARDAAGVALLCSSKPKYPSLFYLFPTADHNHLGLGSQLQPYTTEEYFT